MGLLRNLTGGGIRWNLRLAAGTAPIRPGDMVRGVVGVLPERDLDVRALIVSLIANERYSYVERTIRSGSSSSSTQTSTREIVRQDVPLGGAARLVSGQGFDLPFEITVPSDAPPTFEARHLAVSWKLEVKVDVGGRDPSVEQAIVVLEPAARLVARVGAEACGMRFDGVEDGLQYAIWLEPSPLLLGAPFRGLADFSQPLQSPDARVEVRTEVQSGNGFSAGTSLALSFVVGNGTGNVSETRTLWTAPLAAAPDGAPAGVHRYAFNGQLPLELSPTVDLPDGRCHATLAVIIPRRLRPDSRFSRPVALATAW